MKYWIMLNGVRLGPLSLDEARSLPIEPNTPVWRTGLAEWTTVGNMPEFADKIGSEMNEPPECSVVPPVGQQYQAYPSYRATETPDDKQPPMPNTYLPWAIVVTICCCLVTGIIALIYSSRVTSQYNQGDYAGAESSSSTALTWIWVSVVAGLIMTPLGILLQLASINYFD